ncbi:hypothetical protein N9Z70_04705 [Mariniblastus sp.]|nr:hypothetical protein [Mariniblastus sp.]
MPKFTTISPTCKPGGKPDGWRRFLDGGYIAIGWCYETDLTGKTIDEILPMIPETSFDDSDEKDGVHSFKIFWELALRGESNCDDVIAVKNTNHGLFGIGIIRSGYKYSPRKHDTGVEEHFYPHYLEVDWIHTDYVLRDSLNFGDETSWRPFGTIGQIYDNIPKYLRPYIANSNAT